MPTPIEEVWANVRGLDTCLTPGTTHGGCVRIAAKHLALCVLEEAEQGYARNYAGANEADDVALNFAALRAKIEALSE